MRIRDRAGIVRLGATNLDEDSAHGAIKASDSAGFKCGDSRSVNDVDYYTARAIIARKIQGVSDLAGCCTSDTVAAS